VKSTTSVSNIKTEFSLKNATAFGGAKPFLEYLEKINLAEALNKLNCIKQGNSLFPVFRILLYLIIGWTLGCQRLFISFSLIPNWCLKIPMLFLQIKNILTTESVAIILVTTT
jgi:hypothetical protein